MTLSQPTTMILRFRDLITSSGDTVLNHNNIVTTHNTVWWGWWNKSGETIPDDVFRTFNKVAREKGLRILLLDSGRDLLFEATCRQIHWDKDHGRVASPEPSKTPTYYSTQKYSSWFQLGGINEIAQAELQKFTYVRVDEFFETKASKYASFYGKRVHDADELRQQDRTIWFVRPFHKQDLTHEVRLLNAKQIAPSHFESDFAHSESRHLLWVSDLHFSVENHHAFPLQSTPARKDLGQAIEDAAKKANVYDLAGVLVSGDITWKADSAEFDQAKQFFRRLATSSPTLDNYRFAVCPGNHDLAFSDEPYNKSAAVNDSVAPEASRAEFSKFYRDLFYLNPNHYLSSGRRYLLGGAVPVEIVCLNSSLIDQKKGWFQGHGFVGDEQLKHAAMQFRWESEAKTAPRPFRILVIHHHLMPVTFREIPVGGMTYSVALDAEAIAQWVVQHRVDLVLHGHMHKDFCAKVSRQVDANRGNSSSWHMFHVLGMGSSGVAKDHRDGPNTIGILSFENENVEVVVVTVDPVNQSDRLWNARISRRGEPT